MCAEWITKADDYVDEFTNASPFPVLVIDNFPRRGDRDRPAGRVPGRRRHAEVA